MTNNGNNQDQFWILKGQRLMAKTKLDIMLHPARMRILHEVTGGKTTAKLLAEALPDIPQATLYRHLRLMTEADVLKVVEEIPIRGTVERVYAVGAASLSPDDLRGMGKVQTHRAFTTILSGLLGDFERYLHSKPDADIDLIADGFEYSKGQVHLTDAEFTELNRALWAVIEPATKLPPSSERKRRTFSYLFIPIE
jgi:DNA-binding transcriptional ArsR family regulator